jgi:osmotically-inducible protein OsmY
MNPDIQLRHDVFAQLNWDPAVNACDVDVRVENGVVTLRGEVADEAQRQAAERAARRTEGLSTLLNRLTVQPARQAALDGTTSGAHPA